ncbi:unnamed protein product, partial [Ectocarpus sp. 4 AP-2014]
TVTTRRVSQASLDFWKQQLLVSSKQWTLHCRRGG